MAHQAPLYFVSDAHLGAGSPDEERRKSASLLEFWQHVRREGGDLVIVGDLFDFWFEFRHAIPSAHFEHLVALRELVGAGRRVTYVAGNHDFWAGRFLREDLGIDFRDTEFRLNHSGREVLFAHGDGWLPSEHGYRLMRGVLRNRLCIRLFQMISPDIGYPLADWVSGRSRGRHRLDQKRLAAYTTVARERLAGTVDVLVTAHLHEARHFSWPEGDWLIAGDWIRLFTFGVIRDGDARLYAWSSAGTHRAIEPESSASALPAATPD